VRDLDDTLRKYADLTIRVGLNLQPGQRLAIIGPLANGGVSLDAAPLVRCVTEAAYRAGASYVEAIWGDEALQLVRFSHAPRQSLEAASRWLAPALLDHVRTGDAVLSIYANDPDLLGRCDPEQISMVQLATARAFRPFRDLLSKNATNWTIVAAASAAWARKVFPGATPEVALERLWDAIASLCRLDSPDPTAAWRAHLAALDARKDRLNARRYSALLYTGPGTNLTIGLPDRHVWVTGQSTSANGILFTANLPTEEVFTMPHKDRVDGVVSSSKALSYGGSLIRDFRLRFSDGRIVEASASAGEQVLRALLATDEGAARLGELALVPHGSPISKSGLLFYSTLFDENAASHLAVGSAYKSTLSGGEEMSDADFERAGGNRSMTHVDFMIGSGELDVDGRLADGTTEPVMRSGEWVT
jgi:aminopeptidase